MTGATTVLRLAFINIFGLVLQRAYVALRVRGYIEIFIISSSYHHLSVGSLSRLWFKKNLQMQRCSEPVQAGLLVLVC